MSKYGGEAATLARYEEALAYFMSTPKRIQDFIFYFYYEDITPIEVYEHYLKYRTQHIIKVKKGGVTQKVFRRKQYRQ